MEVDHDPLDVDADTMRRQGYAMVDFLVDHLTAPDPPALVRASPGEMAQRIPAVAPDGPEERGQSIAMTDVGSTSGHLGPSKGRMEGARMRHPLGHGRSSQLRRP